MPPTASAVTSASKPVLMGLSTNSIDLQPMDKKTQSKICNWSLLVLAILMLASGIQMEVTAGADFLGIEFPAYMVFHVVVAILMTFAVFWHIWLHFSWKEWMKRFAALKKWDTKFLAIISALVLVTGIVALLLLILNGMQHNGVGGLHGKIGFIFLAVGLYHFIKRKWFYKSN